MRRSLVAVAADIASEQWGLVTTAQARAAGVTAQSMARLAHTGQVERLRHGVYRLAGTPRSRDEDLRAAWLALDTHQSLAERLDTGPVEVVSHRSAAVLLELGDVDAAVHEFTVPARRQSRHRDVAFHWGSVDRSEWRLVDGLPVTTSLRTIADLAATHLDRGHLAAVVRDALIRDDLSVAAVAEVLAGHAHDYGVVAGNGTALIQLMLDEVGVPASSLDMVRHSTRQVHQLIVDSPS